MKMNLEDWFERWFGAWLSTIVGVLIVAGLYLLIVGPILGVSYAILYVLERGKDENGR